MSRRARAIVVAEMLGRIGLRRRRALADLQKAFEDVDRVIMGLAGYLELPSDRRRRSRRP